MLLSLKFAASIGLMFLWTAAAEPARLRVLFENRDAMAARWA
jgi:hypothetical protein